MIIIAIILLICIIALNKNNNNKITQKSLAEEEQKLINLNIEIKDETEEAYKCLLTFTSTNENEKIKTIEYPTEEGKKPQVITVASAEGKEKIGIDYEIKKGDEDKTFKIETTNGNRFDERTGYNVTYMNDDEIFTTRTRLKTQILPITNLSPKQDGKQFIGYSEDRNATVPDYFENGNAKRDKDTTLYAIYIEEKNGYTEDVNNESLIGKVSKINTSGVQNITVNGITYSANVIVENKDIVLDGEEQIQGATLENKIYEFGDNSQDVATANEYAKNMVILKVNGNLTINSNVTLTACKSPNGYGGPKGLLIYCTGTLSNNGRIDMTARGAWAEGQDVYLWQNADGNYEYVPAEGAEGGKQVSTKRTAKGNDGANGINRQTGGGGSGAASGADLYNLSGTSGSGAFGTSYSGGTGGGSAATANTSSYKADSGDIYGGIGGTGRQYVNEGTDAAGGAGNPGATTWSYNGSSNWGTNPKIKGKNGTGGLLIINAQRIYNEGYIIANGSNGGFAIRCAGSSGGGSINLFHINNYINKGKINCNGGKVGDGGAGGNGSITIGSIATGTFVKDE